MFHVGVREKGVCDRKGCGKMKINDVNTKAGGVHNL